jgi:hypothetical protein
MLMLFFHSIFKFCEQQQITSAKAKKLDIGKEEQRASEKKSKILTSK